jgi:hypothetical protein
VIIEKSKKYKEGKSLTEESLDNTDTLSEIVKSVTYKYEGNEEVKEEKKEEIEEDVIKKTTTTTIVEPPAHHHHHQDLAVVVPARRHADEESIRREIAALEAERRLLKLERSDRHRDGEWEVIETDRRPKDVIRVEKDRKGRMALVRSAH